MKGVDYNSDVGGTVVKGFNSCSAMQRMLKLQVSV